MMILPGHGTDYGPKIAAEIWTGPNNAVGNGVGSCEAGISPRSDTRRAESKEGFRMLLQPVCLKSDRLLAQIFINKSGDSACARQALGAMLQILTICRRDVSKGTPKMMPDTRGTC